VARYGERWARTKASIRRALAAGAAISAVRSARPWLSPGPRPPNPSTQTGSLAQDDEVGPGRPGGRGRNLSVDDADRAIGLERLTRAAIWAASVDFPMPPIP
jgi:hypothetical protein